MRNSYEGSIEDNKPKGVLGIPYQFRGSILEFLLLHRIKRWSGWEFPKGKLDGKSKLQALKDELKQEANIREPRIRQLIYRGVHYTYDYAYNMGPENSIPSRLMYVYLVKVSRLEKIQVNNIEHDRYQWMGYNKALSFLTYEVQKKALRVGKRIIMAEYKNTSII